VSRASGQIAFVGVTLVCISSVFLYIIAMSSRHLILPNDGLNQLGDTLLPILVGFLSAAASSWSNVVKRNRHISTPVPRWVVIFLFVIPIMSVGLGILVVNLQLRAVCPHYPHCSSDAWPTGEDVLTIFRWLITLVAASLGAAAGMLFLKAED
jgi:hypothetical protein